MSREKKLKERRNEKIIIIISMLIIGVMIGAFSYYYLNIPKTEIKEVLLISSKSEFVKGDSFEILIRWNNNFDFQEIPVIRIIEEEGCLNQTNKYYNIPNFVNKNEIINTKASFEVVKDCDLNTKLNVIIKNSRDIDNEVLNVKIVSRNNDYCINRGYDFMTSKEEKNYCCKSYVDELQCDLIT